MLDSIIQQWKYWRMSFGSDADHIGGLKYLVKTTSKVIYSFEVSKLCLCFSKASSDVSPSWTEAAEGKNHNRYCLGLGLAHGGACASEPGVGAGMLIQLSPGHLWPSAVQWGSVQSRVSLGSWVHEKGCGVSSAVRVQMTNVRTRMVWHREFDCKTEVLLYVISIYECFSLICEQMQACY